MKTIANMVIQRKVVKLQAELQLAQRLGNRDSGNMAYKRECRKISAKLEVLHEVYKDINRAMSASS